MTRTILRLLKGDTIDSLQLTPRTSSFGAGIYEAGDTEKCYVKLFVTDTGYVLPVNHRVITTDDLLDIYARGRLDGQEERDEVLVRARTLLVRAMSMTHTEFEGAEGMDWYGEAGDFLNDTDE